MEDAGFEKVGLEEIGLEETGLEEAGVGQASLLFLLCSYSSSVIFSCPSFSFSPSSSLLSSALAISLRMGLFFVPPSCVFSSLLCSAPWPPFRDNPTRVKQKSHYEFPCTKAYLFKICLVGKGTRLQASAS